MKKMLVMVVVLVVAAMTTVTTMASTNSLTLFNLGNPDYKFRVSAGVAWYHDHRQYQYEDNLEFQPDPVNALGLYLQMPVASICNVDICFGGVTPLGYVERTRPELSLDKLIGKHVEIGLAWMASPYQAFSVLLGWRF